MTPPSYLRQFIPTPPPPPPPPAKRLICLWREMNRVKGLNFGLYYESTTDSSDPLAACYVCTKGGGGGGVGGGERELEGVKNTKG